MMKNKELPACSLIVSTYNWPAALNLCLLSIIRQSHLPREVIIADDGSTGETRSLIEAHQKNFPVPLRHVWQPDEGFQLAKIRNKAIAAASFEYIVQIDGDLILHRKFIEDHLRFSKPGYFVTGSRVILTEAYSGKILSDHQHRISLWDNGVKNKGNGIRLSLLTAWFAGYKKDNIYYLRGCNMAFWRTDLIKVNGYSERFTGWGREDNELAARLINSGIRKRVIKYNAIVFHIYHPEKERTGVLANDVLLQETIAGKITATPYGISTHHR